MIEYFFYAILLVILVYNMFSAKSKIQPINYLSLANTTSIKGFFAIIIVFHHLTHKIYLSSSLLGIRNWGYLAVAVFFFYNGYGMMLKLRDTPPFTANFAKRMVKILIPFAIVYLIYYFLDLFDGIKYTLPDIVKSLLNGCPIADNSWYIIFLVLFYCVYWIIVKVFKGNKRKIISAIICFLIIWLVFCIWRKFSYVWYVSNISIVLGMLWFIKRESIELILNKGKAIIIVLTAIIFASMHIMYSFVQNTMLGYLLLMISAPFFVIFVLTYNVFFQNNSLILNFIGKISFEVYLLHGCFIQLFRSSYLNIHNDYLFTFLVLVWTLLSAYFFNICIKRMLEICTKITVKKSLFYMQRN